MCQEQVYHTVLQKLIPWLEDDVLEPATHNKVIQN